MANFEIFSNSSQVYVTIFAFICMAFATFFSRDKKIFTPIVLLTLAIMFDFFAAWREAEVVQAYSMGYGFRGKIISELFLTVISMSLMSLSASYFLSPSLKDFSSIPAWILAGIGFASVFLYAFMWGDWGVVNTMRIIFPLVGFLYLCIGFAFNLGGEHNRGYIIGLVVVTILLLTTTMEFFGAYAPWYIAPVSYILFTIDFLVLENDILSDRIEQSEHNISQINRRIEDIIKSSPFPILITRISDDKIILANTNAIKLFGMNEQSVANHHFKEFFADSNNRQLLLEAIEECKEVQDFEVLIKTPNASTPFWLLTSAKIIDYNYDVVLYLAFQDITTRKSREAMLQNQATRDPLTSIYNRRYFETEVKKQITKLTQERKPYSVLMIDADHFKNINDTYGHKIGDKVLIELATKVEKELREKDIVARFGGEEFVVFLPEINSAQAIRVADRLRESIASIIVYTDAKKPVKFTVSIGVSSSEVSNNIDILIKASDKALYKAKQGGRNRVELFTRKEYMSFEKKGGLPTSENRDKQHPVYNKENNAEISLLDGVNAKDIPNSTIEKKQ